MPAASIASVSSASRPISASSSRGMLPRSSSGSSRSLMRYSSAHSASVSLATQAPEFATRVTSPSAASIRSASRTGIRLAPERAATSSCLIRSPGR